MLPLSSRIVNDCVRLFQHYITLSFPDFLEAYLADKVNVEWRRVVQIT